VKVMKLPGQILYPGEIYPFRCRLGHIFHESCITMA
jgi:hypothetical protein